MIPTPVKGSDLDVRLAKTSDVGDFASHLVRHLRESGRPGSTHFAPLSEVAREDVMREAERRWLTALSQPGWGRTWLLVDRSHLVMPPGERRAVVGHVELRGPIVHASLHRAELSIGIEQPFRGRGIGRHLAAVALDFAREAGSVEWLDLRVFENNERARLLYASLGFTESARIEDAFRMPDGARIDDVLMVKRLR